MRPLWLATAAVATTLAGCGGGTSDSNGAAMARCVEQTYAVGGAGTPELDRAMRDSVQRSCRAAIEDGYVDDGELTAEELQAVLRADPTILSRLCDEAAKVGFEQLPASALKEIDITIQAWGVMFCEVLIEGDYFTEEGFSAVLQTRVFRDHPELGAPFLAAGLMEGYDRSLGISKATYAEIARRTAREAFRRGIVTAQGPGQFDVDRDELVALFRKIAAEVRRG